MWCVPVFPPTSLTVLGEEYEFTNDGNQTLNVSLSPTFATPPSPTAAAAPWIKFTLGNQNLSVSEEVLCCTELNWLLCEWVLEWVSLCNVCFQVCTSSIRLKTVRASDCRSTPRTASTVKRAISRIQVRISTGWCPREEEDQPITACKCGWGPAKQLEGRGLSKKGVLAWFLLWGLFQKIRGVKLCFG